MYVYMYVFFLPKVQSPNHATDSNARWLRRRGLSQKCPPSKCFFLEIFTPWGSFTHKTCEVLPPVRKSQPNRESRITFKRLEIDKKCEQNTKRNLGTFFQNLWSKFTCSAPNWDFAKTSFQVNKKTSIYTKRCTIDVKLQSNTNG